MDHEAYAGLVKGTRHPDDRFEISRSPNQFYFYIFPLRGEDVKDTQARGCLFMSFGAAESFEKQRDKVWAGLGELVGSVKVSDQ